MYVNTVEELGRSAAEPCNNSFRRFLSIRQLMHYKDPRLSRCYGDPNECKTWLNIRSTFSPSGNRCFCGDCMKCKKCDTLIFWSAKQTPNSIHSNVGNYEFWPEAYIANELHKPWFILKYPTNYAAPSPSDFMPGLYTELMTEQEALNGFDELVEKYPNIKVWIPLSTLHIAIYMKWNRMARKIAECIERRMESFTPSGPYYHLSESWTRDHIVHCYDKMREAREGDINYPKYIYGRDEEYIRRSFTNPCMFMKQCIESALPDTKKELIELYGYIWSVSSAYWAYLEKESFYNDSIRHIFCTVLHANETTQMRITRHWPNTTKLPNDDILQHTSRTRCRRCNHVTLQQPGEPVTEYHHVLAYAYQLRQRRFWGVLFCAARLIAKARAVHFVPGIGSAYKLAAAEFSLLRKTV